MSENVSIRVTFDQRSGDGVDRVGKTCWRLPSINCLEEPIVSSTEMAGFSLAVLRRFDLIPGVAVRLGGGIAVVQTDLEARGVSGRTALVMNPNTAHPGVALISEVSYTPILGYPVRFWAGARRRYAFLDGCDALGQVYEAFCGPQAFDDVSAGMAVRLSLDLR